jgi:ribosomal-protein-alanine N-acetyltransferase
LSLPERIASLPVVLRTLRVADAPRIAELCGDWEVARMTSLIPHPYLPGMAEAWIAASGDDHATGTACTYAITRADDGLLVGAIGLKAPVDRPDAFGYWVGRPHWGNGYATAAARGVVALAFAHMDVDVLGAIHLARNPASGRVLAKCGMAEVRSEMRAHRDGPPEAFRVWSIRRDAWEEATRTS